MKRLLQLGFILGLGGGLAAAWLTPWFDYERYRSAASVVANGGRVEQFIVRLPADRVGTPVAAAATSADGAATARLEHFKLRDVNGNVIGLLARHETEQAGTLHTAWLVTLPSRGTIAVASGEAARSIGTVLVQRGLVAGQPVDPEVSIDLDAAAASVATTGEFAGLEVELIETWVVTGIDDDGQVRGTLRLNTTSRRSS